MTEVSYFSTPEFVAFSLHVISGVELPLHIFGTYCILFKSPDSMKSVKWSMLNLHFWSVCLDWTVTFFIIPFVLFPTVAGFSLGMFNYMGLPLERQCYLFAALLCTVNVASMMLFENRYYLMAGKETMWKKFRIPVLAVNYILAFLYPLPAYLKFPEQSSALEEVLQKLPPLPEVILRHQITVYSNELIYFIIPIVFMTSVIGIETLIIGKLIHFHMNSVDLKFKVSLKTISMQKRILTALLIQTSTMAVNFLIPITYICSTIVFNYHNQAANNICFLVFSLHGLTSTSIMLWSHRPYRAVCSNLLRFKRSETTSSKGIQVVNSTVRRNTRIDIFRSS
ncbi:hypothetical protein CAEBREN_21875 [Caenorhabditis brenneri]|uniref:Serpentine Receptor, class H n=1 Tax=Caenorhabditis brenneri TaxID=135651 RepID=G0M8T3_CAEBE|nr:hypothetical protein CAEBREN_21875 [Caenorhabditis brenneri]